MKMPSRNGHEKGEKMGWMKLQFNSLSCQVCQLLLWSTTPPKCISQLSEPAYQVLLLLIWVRVLWYNQMFPTNIITMDVSWRRLRLAYKSCTFIEALVSCSSSSFLYLESMWASRWHGAHGQGLQTWRRGSPYAGTYHLQQIHPDNMTDNYQVNWGSQQETSQL